MIFNIAVYCFNTYLFRKLQAAKDLPNPRRKNAERWGTEVRFFSCANVESDCPNELFRIHIEQPNRGFGS
jgi:hypothetical protein